MTKSLKIEHNSLNTHTYGHGLPEQEEQLFALEPFPLIDINEGLRIVGDRKLLLQMLTFLSRKSLPEDLIILNNAYRLNNWPEIEEIAHKIKGGAVYVGAMRLKIACQYLEHYRKTGERDLLEPLYQQVLTVITDTVERLHHLQILL